MENHKPECPYPPLLAIMSKRHVYPLHKFHATVSVGLPWSLPETWELILCLCLAQDEAQSSLMWFKERFAFKTRIVNDMMRHILFCNVSMTKHVFLQTFLSFYFFSSFFHRPTCRLCVTSGPILPQAKLPLPSRRVLSEVKLQHWVQELECNVTHPPFILLWHKCKQEDVTLCMSCWDIVISQMGF